jgi:hypothetical protein
MALKLDNACFYGNYTSHKGGTNMDNFSTDQEMLQELGKRLRQWRLNRNISQVEVAEKAKVAASVVRRLEAGEGSNLLGLIRVLRVLRLLDGVDLLIQDVPPSPIAMAKLRGKQRKRAGTKRNGR